MAAVNNGIYESIFTVRRRERYLRLVSSITRDGGGLAFFSYFFSLSAYLYDAVVAVIATALITRSFSKRCGAVGECSRSITPGQSSAPANAERFTRKNRAAPRRPRSGRPAILLKFWAVNQKLGHYLRRPARRYPSAWRGTTADNGRTCMRRDK